MEKEKTEAMQQVINFKMEFNCKRKKIQKFEMRGLSEKVAETDCDYLF